MGDPVVVNVYDETGAVAQKGFGIGLVFDPTVTNPLEIVSDTGEIQNWSSEDLAYKKVNAMLSQQPKVQEVMIYGVDVATESSTITDELDKLITQNNDWYALAIASNTEADVQEAANWIASKEKIMFGDLGKDAVIGDIETFMQGIENQNFALFAHDGGVNGEEQYLDAGALGRILPMTPGSYTLKFKTINNTAKATYLPADAAALQAVNANIYKEWGGSLYVAEGVMSNGDFIDTTVAKHWFAARYREEIFRVLKTSQKVGQDNAGIGLFVDAAKQVNKAAARNGAVAKDADGNFMSTVTYPTRKDLLKNDLANRVLKGIKSTVTYSGAWHNVELDFYLTL
jgi:hypothetical protein